MIFCSNACRAFHFSNKLRKNFRKQQFQEKSILILTIGVGLLYNNDGLPFRRRYMKQDREDTFFHF